MRSVLRTLVVLAFLIACVPLPTAAQPAPVTLDGVLSAPYVGTLVSSTDGTAIAYMAHERGLRNVYLMRLGHSPRRVTDYTSDDGHDIGDLTLTRAGTAIAFARGGEANDAGETANPASGSKAPQQEIWIANAGGGALIHPGDGRTPDFSPDAARVVWVGHGQLMGATLHWKAGRIVSAGKARQLFSIRGEVEDPRFSPDGRRIVFTNERTNHSFVVIYDLRAGRLTYATPGFRRDVAPVWSSDGRRIAFVRTPADRDDSSNPFLNITEAPFSVVVADAATGAAHEIWHADPGMGWEYYPLDSQEQLFWSRDDRIAFPWEKNGWRNLYTVAANGGAATDVTPGTFEVESATMSVDGSRLVYATNEGDSERRHIWSTSFDAGTPTQLTSGKSDQWFPAPLAHAGVAYVNAGYADAPQVTLQDAGGIARRVGPQIPNSFPAGSMVEPQLVTFRSADGLGLHGQLFVPHDGTGTHCAVIFVHGGPERQMVPGFHYMEAYANLYEVNQYIVNRGCVVLSINYRSGIMYGHDFREAPHVGALGGAEYADVLAGAHFLQARADVDPQRMGIYGLSYGGYLTAMGLARDSQIFKVGFDMAGVHNWATISDQGYPLGTPALRAVAFAASPVSAIASWRSPVFLAQGDDDRNVPFSQGLDLAQRLRVQGVEVRELVFPNETHEMTLVYAHALELFGEGTQFLLGHLGVAP
jgi:dipeptidyl aminopeptidase/acylaminoacyl peptidase